MSDTTDSTSTTDENAEQASAETPPEGDEPKPNDEAKPAEGEANEDGSEKPEEKPEEGDDEDSKLDLDGAKKALSKVRQEAAKTRTRLREAEEQLKTLKTPEEFEAFKEQFIKDSADEARALLVENVALNAGLAKEFHDRLKGATREELEADAKSLAKLVGTKQQQQDPEVHGGLTPGDESEVFDVEAAREAARKARRSRR